MLSPQSPYLCAIECERYCDILVERLHQQTQVLAARELEAEDMNEVVSEVMKTISSAESKVRTTRENYTRVKILSLNFKTLSLICKEMLPRVKLKEPSKKLA